MDTHSVMVGMRRRVFRHRAPAAPNPGAPLLVALHGTLQNGPSMRRFSGRTLDHLAEGVGADLVYLDGYRRAWNDARRIRVSSAQRHGIDDVAFIRSVIERFGRPAVVVGYSNGGQMLHRFIRETRGLLAGGVSIAAGLPVPDDFLLPDASPDDVPVLLFQGTDDPVVPADGGATRLLGRDRGRVLSAVDTARSYAGGADPVVTAEPQITRYDWDGVRLITQTDVGHVIPNRITSPRFVGRSHHDLDTGEEIRRFFAL